MKEPQKIKVGSTLLSILMALVLLLPVLADAGGGLGRLATGAAPAGPVVMTGAGATGFGRSAVSRLSSRYARMGISRFSTSTTTRPSPTASD